MTPPATTDSHTPLPSSPPRRPRPARRYSPTRELVRARLVEFLREPEAVFWVCGFPILMVIALGIAFRNQPVESIAVDVVSNGQPGEWAVAALSADGGFNAKSFDQPTALNRLRTGKTPLVVLVHQEGDVSLGQPGAKQRFEYFLDPTRAEGLLARNAVNEALQRAAGRQDVAATSDHQMSEPGGRYIDFLVPGLLGMSLMGGGLWGVGFVTVDMRIRKLLKRFLATPMKKSQFLSGIMISRLFLLIPEVVVLLLFSRFVFGVRNAGSPLDVFVLVLLGAFAFSGLGLLVAARPKTIEAVSGLMNLVMLPMWLMSGVFFSSSRFPDAAQPFIKLLPLTALIDVLRAVMLEGDSMFAHGSELLILLTWGVVTFALALKWFRWT